MPRSLRPSLTPQLQLRRVPQERREWKDAAGNRLSIRKITDETARVTFLAAPGHAPITRPWYHDRPSVDMPARYYPAQGPALIVELWEEGKGFALMGVNLISQLREAES